MRGPWTRAPRARRARSRQSGSGGGERVAAHAQLGPRLARVSRASCFGLAGEWGALGVSRAGLWRRLGARQSCARTRGRGGFAGGFPSVSSRSPRLPRGNQTGRGDDRDGGGEGALPGAGPATAAQR